MPTPNSHNRDDGRPRNAIYRVVFLLRGFLAPASTMSAKKIAETIDALDTETYPLLYDTSDKSFVIWNHLFDIWEVVIAMANQIPDADSPQDRIVLLLKKLATVPLAKIELEDVSNCSPDILRIILLVDPCNDKYRTNASSNSLF